MACGGQGNAAICYSPSDGGLSGCFCAMGTWRCLGQGGLPGAGDGGPGMGVTPTPCPANANGMTCPMPLAFCGGQGGGCICLPGQGGAGTWRCM